MQQVQEKEKEKNDIEIELHQNNEHDEENQEQNNEDNKSEHEIKQDKISGEGNHVESKEVNENSNDNKNKEEEKYDQAENMDHVFPLLIKQEVEKETYTVEYQRITPEPEKQNERALSILIIQTAKMLRDKCGDDYYGNYQALDAFLKNTPSVKEAGQFQFAIFKNGTGLASPKDFFKVEFIFHDWRYAFWIPVICKSSKKVQYMIKKEQILANKILLTKKEYKEFKEIDRKIKIEKSEWRQVVKNFFACFGLLGIGFLAAQKLSQLKKI